MKKVLDCSLLLVLFTITIFLISKTHPITALDLNSSRYQIQFAETNIGSKTTASTNFKLNQTLGELAANKFSSTGYIVKAGFEYIHSIIPFTFTISSVNIALGSLVPSTPSTGTTNLTVSFGAAGQYQVTATEIGKLRTFSGAYNIPNTSCDSNACPTSASSPAPWTSSSTYGFGYNMSGQDFPAGFTNSTYYLPFPDRNLGDSPVVVMSSTNVGRNRLSTVTFKANVSTIQATGTYQTVVNFVATPSY